MQASGCGRSRFHWPRTGGKLCATWHRNHGGRVAGPSAATLRQGNDHSDCRTAWQATASRCCSGSRPRRSSKLPSGLVVRLTSGQTLPAQLVVLGVGVRPENKLAVDAGLEVGPRGGIRVNEHLQTSDPDIYAVGDAIEVKDFVTGEPTQVPLAGPANRQGRIAADNIFGRAVSYRGTQGTAIVRVFDRTAAMTGASEKTLRRINRALSQGLCSSGESCRILSRCGGR